MKNNPIRILPMRALALALAAAALAGALASCAGAGMPVPAVSGSEQNTATDRPEEPEVRELKTESIELIFDDKKLAATGLDKSRGSAEGTLVTYDRWISTGYIDVSAYAGLEYELGAHRYIYSVSFFDESRKFISGTSTDSILGFTVRVGHTAVPEGAKYARFTDFEGTADYPNPLGSPHVNGFTSREDYEYYNTSVLKHDGLKIVCIGDSLTEGDYGKAPGVANRHYRNYPYFLSKILGCETVNDGRCGITASGYNSLFAGGEVRVDDADIVLVMLGTNGGLSLNGEGELNGYKRLLTAIKRKVKKDCEIVLMTPPHATENRRNSNYGYNPNAENAAIEVRKLAGSLGYTLIDVYTDSPIQSENEDRYQPVDGLHLSEEGYEALARFIAESLAGISGKR